MVRSVGVVGLGVMGSAMAGHLLAAGLRVHGHDVDPSRAEAFSAAGGTHHGSTEEVASNSELVLLSLPTVAALEVATEGLLAGAHPGLLVVEMGTFPIEAKQEAGRRLASVGVELMDVPVSGTGLQAAEGTLVVMASGSHEGFLRARPVFELLGQTIHHLGPVPNGSIMKFIANLLVTVHTLAAAEAHLLGSAAGLPPELVQQVIADGAGSSRMFEIRGPMMAARRYEARTGRLDLILKDARVIAGFTASAGPPTPLLDTALPLYEQACDEGMGGLDVAAIHRFLDSMADRS